MIDRDRVINWAENARYNAQPSEFPDFEMMMTPHDLLRFAALVAAHEREQCALAVEAVDLYNEYDPAYSFAAAIRARGEVTAPR